MWLCFSIDIYCLSSNLSNVLFQSVSQCLPRYYRNEENLCDEALSDIRLTAIVKKKNLTILSVCVPKDDVWSEVCF